MSDTPDTVAPEGGAAAPKRSFFRRSGVAWIVGALVAAVLAMALILDHNTQVEKIDAAEQRLAQSSKDNARLEQQLESERVENEGISDRNAGLSDAISECVDALNRGVRLYNSLVKQLDAVRSFDFATANRYLAEAKPIRKAANKALRQCQDAAAAP